MGGHHIHNTMDGQSRHNSVGLSFTLYTPNVTDVFIHFWYFTYPTKTIFTSNSAVHTYETRHASSIAARTFIHQCPGAWLALPVDLKKSKTAKSFNKQVKLYYIKQY